VSQPQNQNKKGGVLRATLWAMGLGVFSGLVGYVVALRLSAILSYGSGGSFIVAHVLDAFNYNRSSTSSEGHSAYSSTRPTHYYVIAIASAGLGAVIGYFKGKPEGS